MKIEKEFIRKPVAHNTIKCHIGTPSSLFFFFFLFFIIFLNSLVSSRFFPFKTKKFTLQNQENDHSEGGKCVCLYDCHLLNNYTISVCVCDDLHFNLHFFKLRLSQFIIIPHTHKKGGGNRDFYFDVVNILKMEFPYLEFVTRVFVLWVHKKQKGNE